MELNLHRQIFHDKLYQATARRRLIVVGFHKPFWTRNEAGEGKCHSPPQRKNGQCLEGFQPDSPTGLSFSTAYRERSGDLSHLRKTLNPGVPVLP